MTYENIVDLVSLIHENQLAILMLIQKVFANPLHT